jgi:chemotaxis family two-component system response regulator Rcp1
MIFKKGTEMPIEVLLVEDSPGDVRLTEEAFQDVKTLIRMHVVSDGVQAIAFVKRQGVYVAAPRPDLILLDLNLPKMDGREVLQIIKEDPDLKMIPVVVLTTSGSEEDIMKTYRLHANCFLTKPVDLSEFMNVIRSVDDFWLTKVNLPHEAIK